MAVLCQKLRLDPLGLVFHRECARDNHACPGSKVSKPHFIARVQDQIAAFGTLPPLTPPPAQPPAVTVDRTAAIKRMQQSFLDLGADPNGIDGVIGDDTRKAGAKVLGLPPPIKG